MLPLPPVLHADYTPTACSFRGRILSFSFVLHMPRPHPATTYSATHPQLRYPCLLTYRLRRLTLKSYSALPCYSCWYVRVTKRSFVRHPGRMQVYIRRRIELWLRHIYVHLGRITSRCRDPTKGYSIAHSYAHRTATLRAGRSGARSGPSRIGVFTGLAV